MTMHESEMFIFSGSAKTSGDETKINRVRDILKKALKISIYEAADNKNLANLIIDGITRVIAEYKKVIVLHTHVFNRYYTPLDDKIETSFAFPPDVETDKRILSQFQTLYNLKTMAIGKVKTYLYKAGIYKNR